MVEPEQRKIRSIGPRHSARLSAEELPYRIELREEAADRSPRVLARAQTSALARAIFKAVCLEYPKRPVVLVRGARVIARNDT